MGNRKRKHRNHKAQLTQVSCGCADLSGSCCQSLWNRGDLGPEALTNRPHRGGGESQQEPSEASGTSRMLPLLTAPNGGEMGQSIVPTALPAAKGRWVNPSQRSQL